MIVMRQNLSSAREARIGFFAWLVEQADTPSWVNSEWVVVVSRVEFLIDTSKVDKSYYYSFNIVLWYPVFALSVTCYYSEQYTIRIIGYTLIIIHNNTL